MEPFPSLVGPKAGPLSSVNWPKHHHPGFRSGYGHQGHAASCDVAPGQPWAKLSSLGLSVPICKRASSYQDLLNDERPHPLPGSQAGPPPRSSHDTTQGPRAPAECAFPSAGGTGQKNRRDNCQTARATRSKLKKLKNDVIERQEHPWYLGDPAKVQMGGPARAPLSSTRYSPPQPEGPHRQRRHVKALSASSVTHTVCTVHPPRPPFGPRAQGFSHVHHRVLPWRTDQGKRSLHPEAAQNVCILEFAEP